MFFFRPEKIIVSRELPLLLTDNLDFHSGAGVLRCPSLLLVVVVPASLCQHPPITRPLGRSHGIKVSVLNVGVASEDPATHPDVRHSHFFYYAKNILSHWNSCSISSKSLCQELPMRSIVMDVLRLGEGAIMVGRVECSPAGLRPEPNQSANCNNKKELHSPGSLFGNKS